MGTHRMYMIQIKTDRGDFCDYLGQTVFTGPFKERALAGKKIAELQSLTKRKHFQYRINTILV